MNAGEVRIVDYAPEHRDAFRRLNEEWIMQLFQMEEADRALLESPEAEIIEPGGYIFIALLHEKPVGTCALVRMDTETFELAKMAVAPEARGNGIGRLLGQAAIARARAAGAMRIFLESNRKLLPALELYRQLGFREFTGPPSPYARADIQMELRL